MTKHRLYNLEMRPSGTIEIDGHNKLFGLRFGSNSELAHKFKKLVVDFLNKENLKIVSSKQSFRKHNNLSVPNKSVKGFDMYYKVSKQRTGKIELKKFDVPLVEVIV